MIASLLCASIEAQADAKDLAEPRPLGMLPNILFIVSEDNGPELGCYGDPYVQTPTIDDLARNGVRFERAFVPYSVCSPSRACFLTGLWPQQNGHLGLATHRFALYEPTPSLPSWLKLRGYETGIIGKLHVNPERNFPWDFRAIRSANFGKRNMQSYAKKAREFFVKKREGPWYLQVNFPDAHYPLHRQQFGLPSKPLDGNDVKPLGWVGVDTPRLREFTANYYNCMSRLDSGVKLLLDELDKSGQRGNTMIVYIGDHGAQFSRGKCSVYEAGLRIPMIVQWPGHAKPGEVRNEMVSTLDLVPTMLAAADVRDQPQLPGRSLVPLLAGKTVPWRKHTFGITTGSAPGIDFLQFSVRDDRFKLIWSPEAGADNPFATAYRDHRNPHFLGGTTAQEIATADAKVQRAYATFHKPPEFELYDLRDDPHEFVNLASAKEHRETRNRLLAELHAWQKRIKDPLSDPELRKQFVAEQVERRDFSHRKKGFVWPYLERFRRWRANR
jgi:N-sulfoglucosamine sulfohydrolase